MPKNEYSLAYFKRYSKFYLQGYDTCWRVEAIDSISTPGILEVVAVEYYSNQSEDDIEAGIVGGLIEEEKDPNGEETMEIIGDTFIKVKNNYDFYFDGTYAADWRVDSQYPVVLKPDTKDPRKVTLYWDNPYSGQFTLEYGKYSKIIVVESLF